MPQLLPFYWINQLIWGYTALYLIIYFTSKYILPKLLSIYLARLFITKL